MNKIPVGKTIAHAYRFTFSELGSIIGLAWICLVAIAVLQFLPYMAGGDPMAAAANPIQAGQHAIQSLGISILMLLLSAIIYVAVTRLALGTRPTGAIVHFSLGSPEFRVFGAMFLVGIVLFGIGLVCGIGLAIVSALIGAGNQAVTGLVAAVLIIVVFCALVYIGLRLSFVLVPVTVAEEHISLSRAWILTQGNFWRIFGVVLAVLVPLVIVEIIATIVIVGPGIFAPLPDGSTQVMTQALQARFAEIGHHAPALIGLRLLIAPFQIGLSVGASVFGYRALTAATASS